MDINDSEVTLSQRLQILTAEHSSLVATRALAWSEAFSRTTMFLAVLSGSVVAIALVAQASAFGDAFALFALVLLPMVLFLGVATFFRLSAVNYHDGLCVAGMNRIRHAYLEAAPDLEPHLVMGAHDDREGLLTTMAMPPGMSGLSAVCVRNSQHHYGDQLDRRRCHRWRRYGAFQLRHVGCWNSRVDRVCDHPLPASSLRVQGHHETDRKPRDDDFRANRSLSLDRPKP